MTSQLRPSCPLLSPRGMEPRPSYPLYLPPFVIARSGVPDATKQSPQPRSARGSRAETKLSPNPQGTLPRYLFGTPRNERDNREQWDSCPGLTKKKESQHGSNPF